MTLIAEISADLLAATAGALHDVKRREQLTMELKLLPRLLGGTIPCFLRAKLAQHATLSRFVHWHAARRPAAPAVMSEEQQFTFAELDHRVTGVARALRRRGITNGSRIALLGQPSPAYLALVLGAARAGVAVSLPSPALRGELLGRALATTRPELCLAETELEGELSALGARVDTYGDDGAFERMVREEGAERFDPPHVAAASDYVHIFTSGTTGLPKPCRVTHERALLAAASFSELVFQFERDDRLYAPLPLHHSSALLLGAGSCLVAGVPLILRRRFSASEFWDDVRRFEATAMLYIGELCRALLARPESVDDRRHRLRVAVGNGLSAELWPGFRERFGVEHVREFYAATDVPSAIVNVTDAPGSLGHLPLGRTRGFRLLRVDRASANPVRDELGRAVECSADEPGELVIRVRPRKNAPLGDVPLYTEREASESRLLHDVFQTGDCYYRSGDVLVADRHGYYRFVERLGESFRFKGENVSCVEVEGVLAGAPGVSAAAVVGLRVPGIDGTPPLASLVTGEPFTLDGLWRTVQRLPAFAQPCFVRLEQELPLGETLKVLRRRLAEGGVDPRSSKGMVFLRTQAGYVELTPALWDELMTQRRRL